MPRPTNDKHAQRLSRKKHFPRPQWGDHSLNGKQRRTIATPMKLTLRYK